MSIEFIWVPSRLGIKGNEYVDKLAQDATTKNVVHIDCSFEIFEHNKLILNVILEKRQLMWTACPYGQFYKKLNQKFPFASNITITIVNTRKQSPDCVLENVC